MSVKEIGSCGAYCRTCRAYTVACKGCKLGYDSGERDIARARCKIKLCCLARQLATCADCSQYLVCRTLGALYGKAGYKYGKYRQALDYVRENGYEAFLGIADRWTGAYGKYPPQAAKRRAVGKADAPDGASRPGSGKVDRRAACASARRRRR